MISYFEQLLFEKTKNSQSEILFAQWSYDKKVIPSALQMVSNLFPHYSLHDESHSITIVNNITRILGKENIAKLSAIDIWLILEAAYCHDLGMVVSADRITETLGSQKFINYFKDLLSDTKNGLHEFAIKYKIEKNKIEFNTNEFSLELTDGIKFILAEYFRKIHAERSNEIIINPTQELSISSPRSVIPARIFKILANISASHTKDFEAVMSLPFCEVGIDTEDAHPRFISCLLRIGDLLDLDNNRFSEVMLRTLSKVPIDTLMHKSKHLSIESFRVDRQAIEITANCDDYDVANITQHWFNFLNEEISNQMINWNKIVPSKELGYLPTIGNLKVELKDYDYIDGKTKPKFTVDTDKALELLKGAGLYKSSYQCIRELLQNSIDATLIRFWLENQTDFNFSSPQDAIFLQEIEKYFIEIKIRKTVSDDDYQTWVIEIIDQGTGISSNDLKYLSKTGSSIKNSIKSNAVESMPKWLRPSGIFGIGFQSVFMLTDEVIIETKSFYDEGFQRIELNGPNSKKDGDILLKKIKTSHIFKPGSKVIITLKLKKIPEQYFVHQSYNLANKISENYDPFTHESLDVELGNLVDEISTFFKRSIIPGRLFFNNNQIVISNTKRKLFNYFEADNALELSVYSIKREYNRKKLSTYFKNQKVDNNLRIEFLSFEINIQGEKASDVLTLDRNKIKDEFYSTLWKKFLYSSFNIITLNFLTLFKSEEERSLASMFLDYYHDDFDSKSIDIKTYDDWKKEKIEIGSIDYTLGQLLEIITSCKIVFEKKYDANFGDKYELNDKELVITIQGRPDYYVTTFLFHKLPTYFKFISKLYSKDLETSHTLFLSKDFIDPIKEEQLVDILKSHLNGHPPSSRIYIPCITKYSPLRLRDTAFKGYVFSYVLDPSLNIKYPKMLSPYVRSQTDTNEIILQPLLNETIYNWVFENRFDLMVTRKDIERLYDTFIAEFASESFQISNPN